MAKFTTVLLKAGGFRPVMMDVGVARYGSESEKRLIAQRQPFQSMALAEAEAIEWAEAEGIGYRSDWWRRGTGEYFLVVSLLMAALLSLAVYAGGKAADAIGSGIDALEQEHMHVVCRPPHCRPLELSERYLEGTDGACQAAGMLILRQFEQDPQLKYVYLTNRGWVPSAFRLIDERWARCLAEEFESQYCEQLANPGWYDKDP